MLATIFGIRGKVRRFYCRIANWWCQSVCTNTDKWCPMWETRTDHNKQVLSLCSCIYPFVVFPIPCRLCTALRHCFLPSSVSPTIQIPEGVKKATFSSSSQFVSLVCFLSVQPVPHPLTAMLGRVTDCQRCGLNMVYLLKDYGSRRWIQTLLTSSFRHKRCKNIIW